MRNTEGVNALIRCKTGSAWPRIAQSCRAGTPSRRSMAGRGLDLRRSCKVGIEPAYMGQRRKFPLCRFRSLTSSVVNWPRDLAGLFFWGLCKPTDQNCPGSFIATCSSELHRYRNRNRYRSESPVLGSVYLQVNTSRADLEVGSPARSDPPRPLRPGPLRARSSVQSGNQAPSWQPL
jgi:hypothetical protein